MRERGAWWDRERFRSEAEWNRWAAWVVIRTDAIALRRAGYRCVGALFAASETSYVWHRILIHYGVGPPAPVLFFDYGTRATR